MRRSCVDPGGFPNADHADKALHEINKETIMDDSDDADCTTHSTRVILSQYRYIEGISVRVHSYRYAFLRRNL